MPERPRITLDEPKLAALMTDPTRWTLPAMDDEKPAGNVAEQIDMLAAKDIIRVPKGFRLSVINDDEVDINGLIVQVEAVGTGWPLASDGWSDIDNYLPSWDEDKEIRNDPRQLVGAYADMIFAVIGRADRCLAFLTAVKAAGITYP